MGPAPKNTLGNCNFDKHVDDHAYFPPFIQILVALQAQAAEKHPVHDQA